MSTTEVSQNCIKRDKFDVRTFDQLKLTSAPLGQLATKSEAFAQDVFASLYKYNPTDDPDAVAPHKFMVDELRQMPEWAAFRETTRLDKVASVMATCELGEKLADRLPKQRRDENGDPIPDAPLSESMQDHYRSIARKALKETQEHVEEQIEAFAALCGSEAGRAAQGDPAAVLDLYARVQRSRLLQDVAKIAGRMKRMALRKHAERVKHGPDEVVDLEMGNALGRLVPSELLLADEAEDEFLRKFAEGQLLQYRMEGTETKGRGPIVLCLDSSGSMQEGSPIAREVWGKALALGLLAIAKKEKRRFVLHVFGSSQELRTFDLGDKPTTAQILDAVAFDFHGGTDFDRPLKAALASCQAQDFKRADVVFVTDGECSVNPDVAKRINEEKAKSGVKLYAITIGTHSRSLATVADGMTFVSNLARDAEALEMAFGV